MLWSLHKLIGFPACSQTTGDIDANAGLRLGALWMDPRGPRRFDPLAFLQAESFDHFAMFEAGADSILQLSSLALQSCLGSYLELCVAAWLTVPLASNSGALWAACAVGACWLDSCKFAGIGRVGESEVLEYVTLFLDEADIHDSL
jgi:hypothetical protein